MQLVSCSKFDDAFPSFPTSNEFRMLLRTHGPRIWQQPCVFAGADVAVDWCLEFQAELTLGGGLQ
jgi:hypothetical protein